ncbi:MAG: universal stress protein [Bacteroidetes bacterium]|nr:universal stress protein [Bacteroidota bacterium]MBL7103521.1 universal stress protein [Bacteroidales bacterium]
MKTILVPTDFSDHALFALKVAASIAKKINAKINLVHNNTMPSEGYSNTYYYEDMNKEIKVMKKKQLDNLVCQDFLKNIDVKKYILSNMKMWKIVTNKRFKNVDLIVMGSHGTSGLSEIFIGSNTEKVVRLANSPVLTIKSELKDFNINTMVFASNFYGESYAVFNKIKFFADFYNAHIDLLKVITLKDFEPTPVSRKLMEDFAKKFKLSNYTINIYNAPSIEKGITDFSNEINADLIAIETHGRTGIAHLINGSLAEDVVKHEDRPVLSIKIKDIPANISGLRWYLEKIEEIGSELKVSSSGIKNKHYPKFAII